MKKTLCMAAMTLLLAAGAVAQQPERQMRQSNRLEVRHAMDSMANKPHGPNLLSAPQPRLNRQGFEVTLAAAFPQVAKVKADAKWTEVYDGSGKLLGYAVYSKPASDTIRGWNSDTPVMVALNKKKVVIGVYMMDNMETPRYLDRVADAGLLTRWNGLSVKKARAKEVDAVSGATYTSRAVIQSVRAALGKL